MTGVFFFGGGGGGGGRGGLGSISAGRRFPRPLISVRWLQGDVAERRSPSF